MEKLQRSLKWALRGQKQVLSVSALLQNLANL